MVDEIGDGAGKVWHYLNENPGATLEQVGKSLKLEKSLFYMAVGWLAREGKLTFEKEHGGTKLSLAPE